MSYAQRNYKNITKEPSSKFVKLGDVFANLTVVAYSHSDKQNYFWICSCKCGNKTTVRTRCLRAGMTKSCGCIQQAGVTKHGMSTRSEASIWRNMKYRCNNSNASNYYMYGGKGIKVCERWQNSFQNFYADMGDKPTPEHSIDRVDSKGDYTPDNCRWATKKEQARNRKTSRPITYKGVTKTVIEFCEEYGFKHHQLLHRLNIGWSVEKSLLTPIRERN